MTERDTPRPGDYVVAVAAGVHARVLLTRIATDGTAVVVEATFASRSDALARFELQARSLARDTHCRAFRRDDDGEHHLLEA